MHKTGTLVEGDRGRQEPGRIGDRRGKDGKQEVLTFLSSPPSDTHFSL